MFVGSVPSEARFIIKDVMKTISKEAGVGRRGG